MQVNNQKPAVLSPIYKSKVKGDFEPLVCLKKTLVEPLLNPLIAGQSVTITNNNNKLDADDIVNLIVDCCGDTINPTAEQTARDLFSKTLVYFDKKTPLGIQELFAIQSATKENSGKQKPVLPFPDPNVVYTPSTDVIPVCRQFLAGKCSYDTFFASLAFYARTETLGFYFTNNIAFDSFKAWLDSQISNISSILPSKTMSLLNDFKNINLQQLTESLLLRNDDKDNNDEYSFARVIIKYLMLYTTQVSSAEFGILPFNLNELFCPKSIVFVNVEEHAHATAKQVADEWDIINKSLQMKIKMISNNKISKLTTATRNLQKATALAATASSNRSQTTQKAACLKFRKTRPTTVNIAKIISQLISKMAFVAKSENIYKYIKPSFAKPNRRDPDDFNKMGKITGTKYKPDIHVYADTSGSITERDYEDTMKACIIMAKKLNVNLYFNSFSHILSQCTHLRTKDASTKQIYAKFQKVPKVTGGTDYEQIWHYINESRKRRDELSIIITDFEYLPPNKYVKHPKNLYYVPCSTVNWNQITREATQFCKSMFRIDPNIRKKLLF